MEKIQLRDEIKELTGKNISLEELDDVDIMEVNKFTNNIIDEFSDIKISVDDIINVVRYQKHIYYNRKYNMNI